MTTLCVACQPTRGRLRILSAADFSAYCSRTGSLLHSLELDVLMKKFVALFGVTLSMICGPVLFATSPAERQLAEAVKAPGLSVVHLWAPWCSNCQAELKSGGWLKAIKDNPRVKFYFVSVWNGGEDGRAMLKKFEVADQLNVTILADPGPRGSNHIKQFGGLPLSWIPTTWVYSGGDLRYALNYGEMRFPVLQQFLEDSGSQWSHKGEPSTE